MQGVEPVASLVGIDQANDSAGLHSYETTGMLSEMFNFGHAPGLDNELLNNQLPTSHRNLQMAVAGLGSEWYGSRHSREQQQISSINADTAAAMQLFLSKPQPRSPPRSPLLPPRPPPAVSSSNLHISLPNTPGFHSIVSTSKNPLGGGFSDSVIPLDSITWLTESSNGGGAAVPEIGGAAERQGLSLSLSLLEHLGANKAEELRNISRDTAMVFCNRGGGTSFSSNSANQYIFKNLGTDNHQHSHHQIHVSNVSSRGVVNPLRDSKYAKPAQEILHEICSVGRDHLKSALFCNHDGSSAGPNGHADCAGAAGSLSSSKDPPPMSAADRMEQQRRKVKLLSMLDEVDRRYNRYSEQMQTVVNSYDSAMGFGAAMPYTELAKKVMSRHFRCLKDAIEAQVRHSCDVLSEKDAAGTSGLTKGETPRLKLLEQSLRHPRSFHQMGIVELEAWKPQRGLPERSVTILRAWLFEHFLHPYPSDTDKNLLARQTGLSRNQISNWFINARVRLWKPMVEEMYLQETKEEEKPALTSDQGNQGEGGSGSGSSLNDNTAAQKPTPPPPPPPGTAAAAAVAAAASSRSATNTTPAPAAPPKPSSARRSQFNFSENDPSLLAINGHRFSSENQAKRLQQLLLHPSHAPPLPLPNPAVSASSPQGFLTDVHHHRILNTAVDRDTCRDFGTTATAEDITGSNAVAATLIRFGTTAAGDVSLTLGLRHAGSAPEKNAFPLRRLGS
ncbi:hypothetical protein Nepgr_008301 [Nepenthes gracilis]|uniref:Homeobox domain-containing protein n=1 Tax=Nepenthes gracilis TaxID=150966 RepID=A0AAD3S8T6_NEPGR|nr:hypothetical protein Nepgr_008301 [Nepenthes gracilis]